MDDLLFIQYTGGTTGISKGACLSQKNILSNLKQCELWIAPSLERGKERALAPLPLYHIFFSNGKRAVAFFVWRGKYFDCRPQEPTRSDKNNEKVSRYLRCRGEHSV